MSNLNTIFNNEYESDAMRINQDKEFEGMLFLIEHLFDIVALNKGMLEVKE